MDHLVLLEKLAHKAIKETREKLDQLEGVVLLDPLGREVPQERKE